ncbi:universal stress protein [Paenibacillus lycopersici]|uniref:Universal stress protein n=1 Tax=Paenibacillus lycopersici TaxID=2704462 RepID=A0A6C0FZ80_9BACL|nr:universal stress protein [Paenibacillus lycopersici]QHT59520.1 universal stress protein [Paenibacillus lycopersici]
MSYTRILVAYDGSAPADKALEQAIMLARDNEAAQLEVIHVYSQPIVVLADGVYYPPADQEQAIREHAQSVVDKAAGKVRSIPNGKVILRIGNPAKIIVERAEETRCDLIVIGNRGHGAFMEHVLGSVSHNVVQHAKASVLIVK